MSLYIDCLQHVSLLSEIKDNKEAISYFASYLYVAYFAKGENIITDGDLDRCMHILVQGEADIFKKTPDGDKFKVASLGSKDYAYVGEGALLHDAKRSSTVVATSDSICLALTRDNFDEFCKTRPEWGLPIVKHIALVLSERIRKLSSDFVATYQALVEEIRGES